VRKDSAEAQRSMNPLRIRAQNLRRNNVIENAGEDSKSWSSQRKTRTKVEAFGKLEFFQVQEESAAA
jgi:hypothetical protein